jgi:hypothetical protein
MRRLAIEVRSMCAAGLRDEQIMRLAQLKQEIAAHQRTEVTPDHQRLLFAKYLHENGRLLD